MEKGDSHDREFLEIGWISLNLWECVFCFHAYLPSRIKKNQDTIVEGSAPPSRKSHQAPQIQRNCFFWVGQISHIVPRLQICPPIHFRKQSARDGTENGSKYWWLQGLAAWFSATFYNACVRVDCLPWGKAGIQRGNPLFQGDSRGQNTPYNPYEQWKNPWLFRVYKGSQDLVIWGLFHKPWNKDPYSATSIMESKTVFFRTHTI